MSVFPNHYYFYVRDRDWGPGFIKTCAYAPYPVWLCLNGHEWAKRQAEQRGVSFEAPDNGFRCTDDADALAEITSSLGARDIERFFAAGRPSCPHRSPPRTACAATATGSPCASSSSPTRRCSNAPPRAVSGSNG